MKLVAELKTLCRMREFDSRDEALQFARDNWVRIRRSQLDHLFLLDSCGEVENLWPPTPYNKIPVGYYAVDGKRYHVDRPTEGRFAGWTFVATGSDYHDRKTLASVRPDGSVSRDHRVLTLIAADPFQRAAEYGQITGTCAVCGRKLEDPVSRSIGIGPICRQRFSS